MHEALLGRHQRHAVFSRIDIDDRRAIVNAKAALRCIAEQRVSKSIGVDLRRVRRQQRRLRRTVPERVDLPVASAIYFSVAEALANVTKHAHARSVRIVLSHAAGMLRAEVTDDGAGGADPAAGTGLAGVERRLATFDGILAVSSPPGGPTIVVIEVPCASSSAKTSSC